MNSVFKTLFGVLAASMPAQLIAAPVCIYGTMSLPAVGGVKQIPACGGSIDVPTMADLAALRSDLEKKIAESGKKKVSNSSIPAQGALQKQRASVRRKALSDAEMRVLVNHIRNEVEAQVRAEMQTQFGRADNRQKGPSDSAKRSIDKRTATFVPVRSI